MAVDQTLWAIPLSDVKAALKQKTHADTIIDVDLGNARLTRQLVFWSESMQCALATDVQDEYRGGRWWKSATGRNIGLYARTPKMVTCYKVTLFAKMIFAPPSQP